MKPVIGIPTSYEITSWTNKFYTREYDIDAIEKNGGIPILLPYSEDEEVIDKYVGMIDGLYLDGGDDISPISYGEQPLKMLGTTVKKRDDFELKLLAKAEISKIPVFGVCRGLQMINVSRGGTVFQDIFSSQKPVFQHVSPGLPDNFNPSELSHNIEIYKNTVLAEILNDGEHLVNSIHHQAIKDLGQGLIISAKSEDGIIEAIENEISFDDAENNQYVLGVQWHPEIMRSFYHDQDSLYRHFIEKCIDKTF